MPKPVDLSRFAAALDQDSTLIVVIELSRGLCRDPVFDAEYKVVAR